MRKLLFSFLFVSAACAFGASALAAGGGGGGGGGSSCTQDQWGCTEWGSCSPDGKQVRTCNMIYDCPSAETPSPATTQTCTPPQAACANDVWTCGDWNPCRSGAQTRVCALAFDCPSVSTPAPAQVRSCEPTVPIKPPPVSACDSDVWTCGPWQACDAEGNQGRDCKLAKDCPSVDTPSPAVSQRCDHLQCGNLPTLDARVRCRVNLAPAGIDRELELQYLPEECRAEKDASVQAACIARYRAIVPCYKPPEGEQRFSCGRQALGLDAPVADLLRSCQAGPDAERAACLQALRGKVYAMVKFRFYDLEDRAEDLFARGASTDRIGTFVSYMETEKLAFNQAGTKDERLAIVRDVQAHWKAFIVEIVPTLTK